MKDLPNIGIIGFGFVGSAVAWGFELHANIRIYDKYIPLHADNLDNTVNNSDFLFIAVPTPMGEDGKQDQTILDGVLRDIEGVARRPKTIIIKSTVIPGTCRRLAREYPRHHIVHSPEFLTERSAKLGFINSARIILGGENKNVLKRCENLFRSRFVHTPIYCVTWEESEFIKYMCNCFLTLKVAFCNECYDVAKKIGISYETLKKMFLADQRIGNSHTDVPGHDGKRGYGGTCFPKDINAIINWAADIGYSFDTLKAAEVVNKRVRKE